jgi:hypothetical protein
MACMSSANESHPEGVRAHPSIVVTSANGTDSDLVVQALLPLLMCLRLQHHPTAAVRPSSST